MPKNHEKYWKDGSKPRRNAYYGKGVSTKTIFSCLGDRDATLSQTFRGVETEKNVGNDGNGAQGWCLKVYSRWEEVLWASWKGASDDRNRQATGVEPSSERHTRQSVLFDIERCEQLRDKTKEDRHDTVIYVYSLVLEAIKRCQRLRKYTAIVRCDTVPSIWQFVLE